MPCKNRQYLKNFRIQKNKSLIQVEAETVIFSAHLSQIEKELTDKSSLKVLEKITNHNQIQFDYVKNLADNTSSTLETKNSILVPLRYITASHLHSFSDNKEAESILPELIRDLIVSTINHNYLEMPVGNSVFMHGWDGILNCKEKPDNQFVPEGYSFWEMSKAKNVSKKAKSDFKKRTENPFNQDIKNATFIHVSFRRVGKKEKAKIIANGKEKTLWKDVKVIDAEDLELWLEKSPVVSMIYAKKLALFPNTSGYIPLSDFWNRWSTSTDPSINQPLLLEAGKQCNDTKELISKLNIGHLKIKSNDLDLGIAFFYSLLASIDDQILSRSLISRSMIVESKDSFRLLATRIRNLILIPTFKGAPIGEAKQHGHQIVSIVNNFNPAELDVVGRVRTSIIAEFLKKEGSYTNEKAYRIANSCYGNLSILRLMLAEEGETPNPLWSSPEHGVTLLPLVMLGAWNTHNENDQKIVEKISGKSYSQVENLLETLPRDYSILFQNLNSSYSFYQEYCYSHLIKYLNDKLLYLFFDVAKDVLCEVNADYNLEQDIRFETAMYKEGNKFSKKLRVGIATSLAMLANMNLSAITNLQTQIENLVTKILSKESNWKFWASLNDVITLLAEAAATSFLENVEKIARKSEFIQTFKQTTIIEGCYYDSLLWSLESCAWDRKYFKQTSKVLMILSEIENKKNNYMHQPSNSLLSIYRVLENQSNVSFHDRVSLLQELELEHKNQVWDLIIRMISQKKLVRKYTYRPKFRDIEILSQDRDKVDMHVLYKYLLIFLDKEADRWLDVLDFMFSLKPLFYQLELLNIFLRVKVDKLSNEKRTEIFKKIEKKLAHFIAYKNVKMSIKLLLWKKLKKLHVLFQPNNLLLKWSHVFNFTIDYPGINSADYSFEKEQALLRDLQKRALIQLIPNPNKIDILNDLIAKVPEASILGSVFSEMFDKSFASAVKLTMNEKNGLNFIGGMISYAFQKGEKIWLDWVLREDVFSNPKLRGHLYLYLPPNKFILDMLHTEKKEVQEHFWKNTKRFFSLEKNDDYIYVINKFLEYDRPLDSFYIIANFKNNNQEKIPSDLYIKVLDNLIKFDFINASHSVDLFMYKLEKVLYELQKRGEISKRKLALIEWGFLPFLNYSKIPENLSTEIENDPSLFINILKLAYKKDDLTRNEKINQTITCRAHQLLSNYNILPGMSNGKFDVEHFQNWFLRARLLASNIERIQEFDSIFGLLLAYSPNDPADKSWPHKAVRDLFEKYGTEEMESSLRSRLLNKRGVFIKTIGEGGIQETEIAKVYGNYAKTSEIFWPRMGKILRQLEKNYLSYADREELTALQEDF